MQIVFAGGALTGGELDATAAPLALVEANRESLVAYAASSPDLISNIQVSVWTIGSETRIIKFCEIIAPAGNHSATNPTNAIRGAGAKKKQGFVSTGKGACGPN
jgi:hypothetical protein